MQKKRQESKGIRTRLAESGEREREHTRDAHKMFYILLYILFFQQHNPVIGFGRSFACLESSHWMPVTG